MNLRLYPLRPNALHDSQDHTASLISASDGIVSIPFAWAFVNLDSNLYCTLLKLKLGGGLSPPFNLAVALRDISFSFFYLKPSSSSSLSFLPSYPLVHHPQTTTSTSDPASALQIRPPPDFSPPPLSEFQIWVSNNPIFGGASPFVVYFVSFYGGGCCEDLGRSSRGHDFV
ncbi:hypothetical protein PIB30_046998 [Stylosanthes scabra]|uniref:Uncharacterized protein n=1 Tax=Stylosanthes scabra TaxID=79078 RepID=A0ABU6XHJ6_9FABA|nr:hypothetical protein [Stylosanthes scabra]